MIGRRIRAARKAMNMLQEELGAAMGIGKSSISEWETGRRSPDIEQVKVIAAILNTTPTYLLGLDDDLDDADTSILKYKGIVPVQKFSVPLLGSVAAGRPIYAPDDFDASIPIGHAIKCDFALRVKGDSMEPGIKDGDIVLVRKQPDIEEGRIAVVAVGEEATLKHVFRTRNGLTLASDNLAYPPMVYGPDECEGIRIIGKPVAYIRGM